MSTLASRLKEAMDLRGLNPYRLSLASGVDISSIGRVLDGERERLQHQTLAALAKACKVRMDWLSTGEKPMTEVGPLKLLEERPEWSELVAAVQQLHPDLSPDDLKAVGEMFDSPAVWPGPLDVPAVAALATMHRDWARRLAARGERK